MLLICSINRLQFVESRSVSGWTNLCGQPRLAQSSADGAISRCRSSTRQEKNRDNRSAAHVSVHRSSALWKIVRAIHVAFEAEVGAFYAHSGRAVSSSGRCDRRIQAILRFLRRANTPPHFGELRFGAEVVTEARRSRSIWASVDIERSAAAPSIRRHYFRIL
jgi:hypothetical protein